MEDQLKTLFTELVKFTKTVSPEIWAILIKQQLIYGITNLFMLIVSCVSFSLGMPATKKKGWGEPTIINIFVVVSIGIFIVSLLFFLAHGVSQLFNPEYHALMSLKP